jgi:TolB protein
MRFFPKYSRNPARVHRVFVLGLSLTLSVLAAHAQQIHFADSAEVFLPGLVSTANADVKITFSPDGKKMLWGGIDWIENKKDMDIWQSDKINGVWTTPVMVSFSSDSDDFDPFFSPDGKGVYFFSNRLGGFGGDDIYFAAYDPGTNTFGAAVNVGSQINTAGDEWAPVTDAAAGYLIFSSNGHGGFGGQDLFRARILPNGFSPPENLGPAINGPEDDFDAVVLPEDALVFTSARGPDKKANLYIAYKTGDKNGGSYTTAKQLPAQLNAGSYWTFGPSVNFKEPGYLYFSAHLPKTMGRTDIYRIKYTIR